MKSYLFAAAAVVLVATPALARDHEWYVGIEGGLIHPQKTHFDYSAILNGTRINVPNGVTIKHKTGIDADLIGGYDFGMIRAEAEIGYKRARIKEAVQSFGAYPAGGHATVISSMGNLLFDFGAGGGISAYVGGGVGVARVKYDISAPVLGRGIPNLVDRTQNSLIKALRDSPFLSATTSISASSIVTSTLASCTTMTRSEGITADDSGRIRFWRA